MPTPPSGQQIVIVNHCHPDLPHVCGIRAARFAQTLATSFGHRVVILCEALPDSPSSCTPSELPAMLTVHDWSNPFVLAVRPIPNIRLNNIRSGKSPRWLRQGILAWHFVFKGGVFSDWSDAAKPFLSVLARDFRPDLTWAIFGNTSVFEIARELSHLSGTPWSADFKDDWEDFIPAALQSRLAARFKDSEALTALSHIHARQAERAFGSPPVVIRSGIEDYDIAAPGDEASLTSDILVVGSFYSLDILQGFLQGLRDWAASNPATARKARLRYVGGDHALLSSTCNEMGEIGIDIAIEGFMPQADLSVLLKTSRVNVLIKAPDKYHHKIIEYLAAGRPILCYPAADEEVDIAVETGLSDQLLSCTSPSDVVQALRVVFDEGSSSVAVSLEQAVGRLTWREQAARLLETWQTKAGLRAPAPSGEGRAP